MPCDCFSVFILGFFFTTITFAQQDLSVVPKRIVFENGTKRSHTIYLTNKGADTATYTLSYVHYKLDSLGGFKQIPRDSFPTPSEPYLRVFPKRVTLAPGETQIARLQLRNYSNLPQGEFRSHLLFRGLPKVFRRNPLQKKEDEGVGVKLVPVYGITIPNIVRKGNNTTELRFGDAKVYLNAEGKQTLDFTLFREGNMSVYGDIEVFFKPKSGAAKMLATIPGMGVYAENNKRILSMVVEGTLPNKTGEIVLRFISKEKATAKKVLASYTVPVAL